MLRDTLKTLDKDAARLLFVGAMGARADADLAARKEQISSFQKQVPALGKIVSRIDEAQKAQGKAAAARLLDFAAHMTQVTGALCEPAQAKGELSPLPPAEPIESPLSPTELNSITSALTNAAGAKERPRVLRDAIERGAVRDLRVLPFCVAALGDTAIGPLVESKLLPLLGEVIVPELLASLDLQGKTTDARKLRALAAIQGQRANALLIEATDKGSPELRAAAIEELGKLDGKAAEPIALRLLTADRSMEVRKKAAEALRDATRDESLEALIQAFQSSTDLRTYAGSALSRLPHPRATERALALLTDDLRALTPYKTDPKAKKGAGDKAEKEHWNKVLFLSALLDLLASRKDGDTTEAVLEIFRKHKVKEVKNAAARALLKSGYEGAFDELAPSVYDADWDTRSEFVDSIFVREGERAFERLGRFLDPALLKGKNRVAFAQNILDRLEDEGYGLAEAEPEGDAEPAPANEEKAARGGGLLEKDPRWIDACVVLLDHDELCNGALDVLGNVKSDKALEGLVALASKKPKESYAFRLVRTLAAYRDPRVPALLVKFLDLLKGYWWRRPVYDAMRLFDDPSLLEPLRAYAAGKKRLDKHEKDEIDGLIQFLERDRSLSEGI